MEKITFIFDLDGTLIDPSKYEVPVSTIKAIKKLKESGYPCLIATGRAYTSVCQTVVKELIEWDGYICSNGQHVLDHHGQTIHKYVMDKKRIELAVELAKSLNTRVWYLAQEKLWGFRIECMNECL